MDFGNGNIGERLCGVNGAKDGAEVGLSADMTGVGEARNGFELGVIAKNDYGMNWQIWRKEVGDSSEMSGILFDRIIETMLFAAKIENLSPFSIGAVTENPAGIILGFKNENSLLVDCEAVNLNVFGSGGRFGYGIDGKIGHIRGLARRGIDFWSVVIGKNVDWIEVALQAENEAGFGGGELDWVRRGDFGAADSIKWLFHRAILA